MLFAPLKQIIKRFSPVKERTRNPQTLYLFSIYQLIHPNIYDRIVLFKPLFLKVANRKPIKETLFLDNDKPKQLIERLFLNSNDIKQP